jgi:protein-disulfide isomerase
MSAWVPRLALGADAVVVVSVVVSIAVGEGGPQARGVDGVYDVQRIYAGIAQEGAELGPPDAEVKITVFNDLQCDPCASYHLGVVEPLVEDYARTGQALLELRHFSMGRFPTTLAALGASAAGEQGHQWQYAALFFRNQDLVDEHGVTEELLREVAAAMLGFELAEWEDAFDTPAVAELVENDARLAAELRLPADPAVIVSGPSGQRELVDSPSLDEIEAAIAEVE